MIKLLAGEPGEGESSKAIQACNDFLRLGPGRTLSLLLKRYGKRQGNAAPTTSRNTLEHWSAAYGWQDRADEFDAVIEDEKTVIRKRIWSRGFANDYKRLAALNTVAEDLFRQLREEGEELKDEFGQLVLDDKGNPRRRRNPNLYVRDVKQIGSGEYAQEVEIERYNSALVNDFRGLLDDIAKEKNERRVLPADDNDEDQFADALDSLQRKIADLAAREAAPGVSEQPEQEGGARS